MPGHAPPGSGADQQQDTLFLVLTRPPMRWGVPFESLVWNGVLTFFVGLWMGSPLYWLIGVVIHFPMRVIASKDHNFFRVYTLWAFARMETVRSSLWGGSMLSPLPTEHPKAKGRASCV